jgi:hypothetical protein
MTALREAMAEYSQASLPGFAKAVAGLGRYRKND